MNQAIPFCNQQPTLTQQAFLDSEEREVLFGGGMGSGKTVALLMSALLHTDKPGYSAIIFRKEYRQLVLPGGTIDSLKHLTAGFNGVHWDSNQLTMRFPNEAMIRLNYLDEPTDKERYKSSQYQFIGLDMAGQVRESDYRYLMSRLRNAPGQNVPLRARLADNAGNGWVNERFVSGEKAPNRAYVPSKLEDNPHIGHEEYRKALRAMLDSEIEGNWPEQ